MSGGSSPPRSGLGGFSSMLSSVSILSKAKLDRMSQVISARQSKIGLEPSSSYKHEELSIGVASNESLSIVDPVDPSEEMGDDDLEEDHDQYESGDDEYDHEADDLLNTEKNGVSP